MHLSTGVHGEWKPEALDPLAMELSVVMSHMMWVPVIEFSSSARPRGALNLSHLSNPRLPQSPNWVV